VALIEIRIDLEPSCDPIGGTLYDSRGAKHEFHGWLQLISLLELARADPSETVPAAREPDRSP
jgi:hypothetical protein